MAVKKDVFASPQPSVMSDLSGGDDTTESSLGELNEGCDQRALTDVVHQVDVFAIKKRTRNRRGKG